MKNQFYIQDNGPGFPNEDWQTGIEVEDAS